MSHNHTTCGVCLNTYEFYGQHIPDCPTCGGSPTHRLRQLGTHATAWDRERLGPQAAQEVETYRRSWGLL